MSANVEQSTTTGDGYIGTPVPQTWAWPKSTVVQQIENGYIVQSNPSPNLGAMWRYCKDLNEVRLFLGVIFGEAVS